MPFQCTAYVGYRILACRTIFATRSFRIRPSFAPKAVFVERCVICFQKFEAVEVFGLVDVLVSALIVNNWAPCLHIALLHFHCER